MKNKLCIGLAFLLAMMLMGCTPDKEAMEKRAKQKEAMEKEAMEEAKQIKSQVDEVVIAIDGGKKAEDFKKLATEPKYYVFIMDQSGNFLVHPRSTKLRLYSKEDQDIYIELVKGTTEGLWVEYPLSGLVKRVYVKKTQGGLFVASGY